MQSSSEIETVSPADEESAPESFAVPAADERHSLPLPDLQAHPFHFHHQSGRDNHIVAKLLCSTCNSHKSSFYCFACVNRGEFVSSRTDSSVLKEKFCEKRLRLLAMLEERQHLLDALDKHLQPAMQLDILQSKVNQQTARNERLRQSLEQREKSLQQLRGRKIDVSLVQHQAQQQRDINSRKVAAATKAIRQIREKVCNKKAATTEGEGSLRELTWDLCVQLRSHIFTLESYEPEDNDATSSGAESVPLLGYPTTQWAAKQKHSEVKYTIVEPWLPAVPDVSSYCNWGNPCLSLCFSLRLTVLHPQSSPIVRRWVRQPRSSQWSDATTPSESVPLFPTSLT